jgi:ATP-dependent RNA helicase DDX24/MAK5
MQRANYTPLYFTSQTIVQVYVHRSGRTARANQTGTTVSLVSPEDAAHHRAICAYLGVGKGLPLLQVDLYCLPMLRQRVALAKQVRTQ